MLSPPLREGKCGTRPVTGLECTDSCNLATDGTAPPLTPDLSLATSLAGNCLCGEALSSALKHPGKLVPLSAAGTSPCEGLEVILNEELFRPRHRIQAHSLRLRPRSKPEFCVQSRPKAHGFPWNCSVADFRLGCSAFMRVFVRKLSHGRSFCTVGLQIWRRGYESNRKSRLRESAFIVCSSCSHPRQYRRFSVSAGWRPFSFSRTMRQENSVRVSGIVRGRGEGVPGPTDAAGADGLGRENFRA
jgi:hypothetical protein